MFYAIKCKKCGTVKDVRLDKTIYFGEEVHDYCETCKKETAWKKMLLSEFNIIIKGKNG
jgi:predicted nucleic acid-binding Zn ribbon protein